MTTSSVCIEFLSLEEVWALREHALPMLPSETVRSYRLRDLNQGR
jgi:hypothetical protein